MYYNGDAIWYFLKEIYPQILKESPIPLTIAGREIPDELRKFAKDNDLDNHLTFAESVKDVSTLYDSHRVFIAPHLYGAGIQFKVSFYLISLYIIIPSVFEAPLDSHLNFNFLQSLFLHS